MGRSAWRSGPMMVSPAAVLVLGLLLVPTSAELKASPTGTEGGIWPGAVEPGPRVADRDVRTGPVSAADTVTAADSARLRVLERLRERNRPTPDAATLDSLMQADTVDQAVPPRTVVQTRGEERARPATQLPEGADSIMRALAQLPGYSVAAYQGREAEFEARDRRLILFGTPEDQAWFSGQGNRVAADSSITYDDATGRVRTTGLTLFTPQEGDPVESRTLIYDVRASRGTAAGARTTYSEGATWFVEGDLDSVEQGRLFGSSTRFTSCDHDPPHSYFEASDLKVVANQVLVARGVRMYVEDVPVMWLPFMAQNLGSGRASGILTPAFSMNDVVRTSSGYNRRISNIGYYWAMSDYSDMTMAVDWFSNNYMALTGALRYRWRAQFLTGNVDLRRYWRETGQREFGVNTRHNWEISERTRANASARFMTSSDFVREQSFDPRELTQTINSEAGFSHRFDWGNLSVSANRRQHLTDDRVDMNLPNVSLNINTMTLFAAPPQAASWYNNLNLGGRARFNRDVFQRAAQPDTAFQISRADELRTRAEASASASLGDLSLGTSVQYNETVFQDVPGGLFGDPGFEVVNRMGGFTTGDGLPPALDPFLQTDLLQDPLALQDFGQANINWSANLGYRVNLIGQTTFTPGVSISGEMLRADTFSVANEFVAGPRRVSATARLQTELYGFYPGFRDFTAIRHKLTPSVNVQYSPQVRPTDLQRQVFGARTARPRKIVTLGMNQTWEARLDDDAEERPGERDEDPTAAEGVADPDPGVDPGDPGDPDVDPAELPLPDPDEETDPDDDPDPEEDEALDEEDEDVTEDGLRRAPQSRTVTLLGLSTNAVTYDLVEADSTGRFLDGFQTTRLSNTVRSDYLRGLSFSFEHDLFAGGGFGEDAVPRSFAPHLSRVNLSFQIDHQSRVVQWVTGFVGIDTDPEEAAEADPVEPSDLHDEGTPAGQPDGFDPSRITPGDEGERQQVGPRRDGWNARVSYSLQRPRDENGGAASGMRRAMLQWGLSFAPSANWDASWQTSYDLVDGRFNDHAVELRRDLHEWEAIMGFRQTVTGNWSFTFEVALRANRDLSLDYSQRDSEGGRRPGGVPR